MANRWKQLQRGFALAAMIAVLVTSLLTPSHRHADHNASDTRCAACILVHHVGAVAEATLTLAPPADLTGVVITHLVLAPMARLHARESGRAPPVFLLA